MPDEDRIHWMAGLGAGMIITITALLGSGIIWGAVVVATILARRVCQS